jgi:3-oxoacyl-[acyl-carrier protein] reductase
MVAGGYGRIVNISSMDARTGGLVVTAHYAASKAGLLAFTKTLAREVAPHGITVNAVAPGSVLTDMTRPRIEKLLEEQPECYRQQVPLGRCAAPEEIASAVLFLASPASSYMTGATLDVNGGWLMP